MTQTDFEQLLGLSENETAIYRTLSNTPQSVADIRRAADLPRMTAHYALERFAERGLVKRMKRNKRFVYTKVSPDKLIKETILSRSDHGLEVMSVPVAEDTDIIIHKSWEQILYMYASITKNHSGGRFHTIQTTSSTKHIYENFSLDELDEIHQLMNKHNIIVEDIVEEDFFAPIYHLHKDDLRKAAESFLDRTTVTYALPKDFIDFESDILILHDLVIFIDWSRQIAIEVHAEQVIQMCKSFYEVLKKHTKKVQFKDLAKPYLEKAELGTT